MSGQLKHASHDKIMLSQTNLSWVDTHSMHRVDQLLFTCSDEMPLDMFFAPAD